VLEPRTDVPPYNPPKGFLEQAINAELSSVKAFQGVGPEGKQIWHIEAPALVDISSLQQLALRGIKNGQPVLSHGDNQYAFVQDLSENRRSTNAIIPSSAGGYHTASQPITQTLRLQLVVPDLVTSASPKAALIKKPVRPQPDNLKQRFQPLGAKRKRVKEPKLEKAKRVNILPL
jgi:DNA-directed RNA polymerase I subunit RPA34.5